MLQELNEKEIEVVTENIIMIYIKEKRKNYE